MAKNLPKMRTSLRRHVRPPKFGQQPALVRRRNVQDMKPVLAVTTQEGTSFAPSVRLRSDADRIVAHELIHRAQFASAGTRPFGTRVQLEDEAHAGAAKLVRGKSFVPAFAAPASMRLAFSDPAQEMVSLDPSTLSNEELQQQIARTRALLRQHSCDLVAMLGKRLLQSRHVVVL